MVRVHVTRMKTCRSVEIVEAYCVHLITWVPNRWPLQPYLQTCLSEYGGRLLLASLSCDVLPAVLGEAHLTEGTRASFLATRDAVVGSGCGCHYCLLVFCFPGISEWVKDAEGSSSHPSSVA